VISIILPVLNEEQRVGQRLAELAALGRGVGEVLVVDGGSTDATVARARDYPGVTVLSAPRGRASQMNAGAEQARGDVLLFLHADVALPPDAPRHIHTALEDPRVVAGAFKTWTVNDTGLRSRYTRLPYGDQALFIRADVFRRVGGFPAQPLMEDLELSTRLWREGRVRTVDACVTVSGRRFLARPVFYFLAVNGFPLLYRLGVSPATLLRVYAHVR
jgi:rSAM/selenodomain-associated transferase 2